MRKKLTLFIMLALTIFCFSACGKSNVNLNDRIIEKRENLFDANDKLYSVNLTTGTREKDYDFDGVVNEMVPFAILTLARIENLPLANDTYSYIVTVGEQTYNGFLEKSNNNSYSADLEADLSNAETINVRISFTGYTFNENLEKISSSFQVDSDTAIKIAEKELKESLKTLLDDKNVKIEVIMKIMKDFSSEELKSYYWYVGIISTNGETLGILISANNGDIIAKKV